MKQILKAFSYLIGILIIMTLLYNFVFFVIKVPSASMYPTIKIGDRIITTRIINTSLIKRGDILVFYSDEFKETMVKRVIGLPNDKVEISSDGRVTVNNTELNEAYVKYPENLSGSFKVPEGEYFFLGDNRQHSYDSRKWDNPFIPEDKILGKAQFIILPFDRISMLEGID